MNQRDLTPELVACSAVLFLCFFLIIEQIITTIKKKSSKKFQLDDDRSIESKIMIFFYCSFVFNS